MPQPFAKHPRRYFVLVGSGLIALSVVVRLRAMQGDIVGDGDIGLYVLIARAWLHGALPYTTLWEYKPPGLFAVYALALAACSDATRAMNVIAIVATSATSVLLWRLVAVLIPNGEAAGIVAGAFWACISIENDGLLGDAELLTVPFAAGSLLALTGRLSPARFAAAGLLAALAVQMKLTALPFVVLPFALVIRDGGLRALLPFGTAFLAPPILEAAVYAWAHHFSAIWDANIGATLRRAGSRAGFQPPARDYGLQLRIFTPAIELAPLALLRRGHGVLVFVAWLLVALTTLVGVGEFDLRQFVPLVPPLAALGAIGLDAVVRRFRIDARVLGFAVFTAFMFHGYYEVNMLVRSTWKAIVHPTPVIKNDEMSLVIEAGQRLPLSGALWVVEGTPLLYDLLHVKPPTRYPLTSDLLDKRLWPMLGFRGTDEITTIIDRRRPEWIIAKPCGPWADPSACRLMRAEIHRHYDLVRSLDRNVQLYRRIPTPR